MIILDPYNEKHTPKIRKEIEKLLREEIALRIKDREDGIGINWNDSKEIKLQNWLDDISNKYDFDFRLVHATFGESLFPEDYKQCMQYC